jgi:alkyl hydroperoxide reductase subunit F
MLDQEIKTQLREVFNVLDQNIELRVFKSAHADQGGLIELLEEVESTSSKIKVVNRDAYAEFPCFEVALEGQEAKVCFEGIPGGHEFSTLIVAILNSAGKGKMPDEGTQRRIKNLKLPEGLKTYISLSCENCPDVVQALNLMALIHPEFKHTLTDGAYVQEEIERLKIQGVPSVMLGSELIHSGKISFGELIDKLEKRFGKTEISQSQHLGKFDVLVIGGGPAGVSAAIYSVRKGLKTALIAEKMGGQVQETKGIENLISVVYTEGPELSSKLHEHLRSYPVQIFEHRRVEHMDSETHSVHLSTGEVLEAQSIIVSTGAKWRELNVPGEKEYLGRGVAFCPHCDGPFYQGKKVAVIGGGNSGVEAAIDLSGIVREVELFEYNDNLKADKVLVDKMKSIANIKFHTSRQTKEIIGNGEKVTALQSVDRKTGEVKSTELDGVFIQIGLIPNSQFLKGVVELTPYGEVKVDAKGRTSSPWIYAAGDVTTVPYKQIVIAMGEGAKVGLTVFEDRMLR